MITEVLWVKTRHKKFYSSSAARVAIYHEKTRPHYRAQKRRAPNDARLKKPLKPSSRLQQN